MILLVYTFNFLIKSAILIRYSKMQGGPLVFDQIFKNGDFNDFFDQIFKKKCSKTTF